MKKLPLQDKLNFDNTIASKKTEYINKISNKNIKSNKNFETVSKETKNAAIVLGGGLQKKNDNGNHIYYPHAQVIHRLDMAYEMFLSNNVDYIVTTGNYSKRTEIDTTICGPKTEAEVGRLYLLDRFKLERRKITRSLNDWLLFENLSFDTLGNAWFTKKLCLEPNNIKNCIIITSDFHMQRSKILFEWILGPDYDIKTVSIPSEFEGKQKRIKLEKVFTDFINKWLVDKIAAGDDKAIDNFIKNEHLIYCLSERSQAFFKACLETASIKAGY